jgi:hypothetical protein
MSLVKAVISDSVKIPIPVEQDKKDANDGSDIDGNSGWGITPDFTFEGNTEEAEEESLGNAKVA